MKRDQTLSITARQGDLITLRILPPAGQRALKAAELRDRLAAKDRLLVEIRNDIRQIPLNERLMKLTERALEV